MRAATAIVSVGLASVLAGCAVETYPRTAEQRYPPTTPATGPRVDEYVSHTASEMSPPGTGRVSRIDVPQQVIVLDDGRTYRIVGDQAILVDGRPATLASVQPGSTVTVVRGAPVRLQDGRYVVVTPGPAAPQAVVVPAAASPRLQHRLSGRVEEIERDGDIKVQTSEGAFEFRAPAGHAVREGDTVTIDVTITPAGVPAASPR